MVAPPSDRKVTHAANAVAAAKPSVDTVTASDAEGEVEALLRGVAVDVQPKRVILKRDVTAQDRNKAVVEAPKPEKSLAQREREYEAAKQRIFDEGKSSPLSSKGPGKSGSHKKRHK